MPSAATGKRAPSRSRLLRWMLVGVFVLVAGWTTITVSVAHVFGARRPDVVLRLAPYDARANAAMAEAMMKGAPPGDAQNWALELATKALLRDLTVISAWRILATAEAAAGDDASATKSFQLIEAMSRRDVPTQLWLLMRQKELSGVLLHADRALRRDPDLGTMLFPVIISALKDKGLARPLAEILLDEPPWREPFFRSVSRYPGVPGDNLATMVEIMAAEGPLPEWGWLAQSARRLVGEGQYGPAFRLYAVITGNGDGALVRNANFDRGNSVPPLDWRIEQGNEFGAVQTDVATGPNGPALLGYATMGHSGTIARQLLKLPPGTFAISAVVGSQPGEPAAKLGWSLTCANAAEEMLLDATFPALTDEPRQYAGTFRIPASDCPVQWLSLEAAATKAGRNAGWFDSIAVQPSR